ncbi:MAG TPA: hypothetical protein VFP87_15590 [Chitinophagaceae bacterium]|nr:hypothetical protein [Chitinophagaceae bacterium]
MEYLLFVGYLVLFAWLVTRTKFFNRSGLSNPQLVIIFFLKVMAGIFYGWVGIYYGNHAQMVDTWSFHYNGIQEYNLLFKNPHEYLVNLFRDPYEGGVTKFFGTENSYWNDLKGNFFIKVLSIFNIFSFGHYYTNIIFYSFISMFGPIAIYRVMNDVYPGKKWQLLIAVFLLPSFLYWASGLHKEGLIFLGFSLVIFNTYFGLRRKRFSVNNIIFILLGLLLVLILRNFLIVIFIPAIIAWFLASKFSKRPLAVFAICYCCFVILFFTAKFLNANFDFPQAVVTKQREFVALHGNSSVPMQKLEPTFSSFVINTPQAISLSMLRPYPSDVKHLLSLAAAAETDVLLLLVFIFLLWRRKNGKPNQSSIFIYFCLFLSFSVLITIGYAVNNLGAIVRYRSIVLPLLLSAVFCGINWQKINSLLFNNISNQSNITRTSDLPS